MQPPDVTASFNEPPPARRAAHIAFMAVLALAGWGILLAASYLPGFGPGIVRTDGGLAVASFFLVMVVTRRLATPMLPQVVVSLDTAFYVASAVCLGSVAAGRLVGVALMLDAIVRVAANHTRARSLRGGWIDDLIYVLYFSGMSGALLMAIGWLFGVDGYSFVMRVDDEWVVLRLVSGVGLTFLVAHYAISGLRLTLLGSTWSSYLRRMALPGAVAEASLLPLAVVVVLIYRPDHPLGFLLLAATYVLLNLVFNRLRRTGYTLSRRVQELETLNATSRELAASLQLHELVESLSRETARALPATQWLTLVHRGLDDEADDRLIVDSYDCERRKFERFHVEQGAGPGGWVLANGQPLNIKELRDSDFDPGSDSGVRSWLGVPLVVHGETAGVLAVQSRERAAFGADDQRLLESIGAQAAIALQNARLYELAMVDGLTRLFVRRYFDARLEEEVERARRFGTEFSVVMMDIDDFKQLNDTHGHQAGDAALVAVAEIVDREMRAVDTAARYGGEEFSMVLPRTSLIDAYSQADRIRRLIEERQIAVDDQTLRVTASFGIAAYPESGTGNAPDIVRRADTALYRAKQTGKNRVELYWAEGGAGKSSLRPV